MPENTYSLRRQTLASLTRIKRPDVPLRVVLRNTAAVILPLAVGLATGHTAIGLGIGAGALNTMFSDQPGPYRKRLQRLLLATLAAGVAALAGFLVGGQLLPMLVITAGFGFVGGMLVLFGADTARVGMISMILLVVTGAYPTTLANAVGGAALIVAGGTLLGGLSLAAWPWQRYRPERNALADVYDGLAVLARQSTHGEADAPALSDAMTTLQRTLLGRHRAHGRAMEAFRVMLELAERIRLQFTAISELHTESSSRENFADHAARIMQGIADALRHGDSPIAAQRALQQLKDDPDDPTARSDQHTTHGGLATHLQALKGQLAAAVRNADWAGSRGEVRASLAEATLPRPLRIASGLARLRANLTPRSAAFRHALRTSVCLCVALLLSRLLPLSHGYWLPMTAAIVLRPDFAATFSFGLLRVLGTLLGLALTTALLYVTPAQPWAHLALMALLCMGFRYLATAHYGLAVAALTGTVVILLSFEGVNPGDAVIDRVINTSLGCAMALLAYLAWPTWERVSARTTFSELLHAYADYLAALAGTSSREVRDKRYAARIARTNAQASLERMRSEPGTPADLLQLARALDANGNRLARSSMALEALLSEPHGDASLQPFITSVAAAVEALSRKLRQQCDASAPPDLRAQQLALAADIARKGHPADVDWIDRVCDRLVDNVNTLTHVIARGNDAEK